MKIARRGVRLLAICYSCILGPCVSREVACWVYPVHIAPFVRELPNCYAVSDMQLTTDLGPPAMDS